MITINSLDPSQKNTLAAVLNAKEVDDIFLVYGPPGTGKSELVVSLLFELATRGKRILFVSQNTEALKVIDRMISRVEKDINYPSGSDLSLKNFCLNLYSGEHRYLKYIRSQYTRLIERSLPTLNSIDEINDPITYPLGYVHLDHIKNYKNNDKRIGVDEMLTYFLHYVSEEFMVEPLQNFQNINLRKIFTLIDTYGFKDKFYFYVAPQNELRYLSTTNFDIKFDQFRASLAGLKELVDQVDLDTRIKVKKDISIFDYLSLIESYHKVSKFFDLYFVLNKKISIDEIQTNLTKALELSKELIDEQDKIQGILDIESYLPIEKNYISYINKDFKKFDEDIVEIYELIQKITEHIEKADLLNFHDFVILALQTLSINSSGVVKSFPELQKLNESEIKELITSAENFESISKFIKPFSPLPPIFKEKLKISSKSAPGIILKNKEVLEQIAKILCNTSYTVKTVIKLEKENTRTNIKVLDIFKNIAPTVLEEITQDSFKLLELFSLYSINDQQKISEIKKYASKVHVDNNSFESAKEANNDKIVELSTAEFVKAINKTIKHQNATKEIKSIFEAYKKTFLKTLDFDSFISFLPKLISTLEEEKNLLEEMHKHLDIPVDYVESHNFNGLSLLKEQLVTIEAKNIYSMAFFTITEGQNIPNWYMGISHISFFNGINEFDNYIVHNQFIDQLGYELGVNSPWLTNLLSAPDITYENFTARFINTLVRSAFQHLPSSERPTIGNKFFPQYNNELISERHDYYVKGLSTIRKKILSDAQILANPNNWEGATTTMEKIRNNTKLISHAYPIIIATPKEVAKYLKPEKEIFDYVIFDEASQLLPGQAIPSLFRGRHAVVIGDPHQMPPILSASIGGVASEEDDEDLETDESILDLLRKQPQNQYHLKVHYRSESNMLFEPSRTAIYREDGIEPIFEAKFKNDAPISIEDNLGFFAASADKEKKDNKAPKYDQNFPIICQHIQKYLNQDNTASFCILFTRAEDLHSFKDFLAENESEYRIIFNLYIDGVILLSTVSNCQGIEGTYSILYFRHYDTPGGMWFFKESAGAYKRLNVAITRQRRGLTILMADPKEKWLQVCEAKEKNMNTGPNTQKSVKLLQSLLTNAGEVIDEAYLDRRLGNNVSRFDSPLTEQIYKKLVNYYNSKIGKELKIYYEIGWHIEIPNKETTMEYEKNIGFRIDIGIYSISKKEFILGIEMDGATYHSGYDRNHSDNNRQTVLEKRKGWELYRIWSTNWLHDQKSEFEKLTQYINTKL